MDHSDARRIVRAVLAADFACDEQDFLDDGVTVTVAEDRPLRRRFPRRGGKALSIATMGAGAVVCSHPDRLDWLRAHLGSLSRDEVFAAEMIARLSRYVEPDGQAFVGPHLKYVCTRADLRPGASDETVDVSVVEGENLIQIYRPLGFSQALRSRVDPRRPDVVATVATRDGEVVGIAGASADCDAMWQVGIHVVASARRQGIGRALVRRLTAEILERGRLPYYSTTVSNLASRALAFGVGFWPAWIELWAYERPPRHVE